MCAIVGQCVRLQDDADDEAEDEEVDADESGNVTISLKEYKRMREVERKYERIKRFMREVSTGAMSKELCAIGLIGPIRWCDL